MRMSPGKKVLFALGQFGLVLCGFGAGKLFASFYVDRGLSGESLFPVFIYQGYFFGFFTVAGLIIALCSLVQLAGGMFAGNASDRSLRENGRRTAFMRSAAIPLALFSALVFFPPTATHFYLNSAVVLVYSVLFYLFLALYTVPYLALLPELGASTGERIELSALLACSTAFASILGNRIPDYLKAVSEGLGVSPVTAFRLVIVAYALVSAVCLLLPALLVDERKYADVEPVHDDFSVSAAAVFSDRYFRFFLGADFFFRLASAFAVTGFFWYVTVLLGETVAHAGIFTLVIFFTNLALYIPVGVIAARRGKRKILGSAYFMLAAVLVLTVYSDRIPVDSFAKGLALSVLIAFPVSVFTVVPNALVSDLVIAAERRTGVRRSGMYYGMHAFEMRTGQLVAAFLFPVAAGLAPGAAGTVVIGNLKAILLVAAGFLLAGLFCMYLYREKEVNDILDLKEQD